MPISDAELTAVAQAEKREPGLIHELIEARWSPQAFTGETITDDQLRSILSAAGWASSSFNEQPWRFVVARRQDDTFKDVLSVLVPPNQAWAKQASVLILMAAKKTFSHNNSPNTFALHDTGAALANLLLQATALGLHGHAMGGYDRLRARELFGVPDEYELASVVALGFYRGPDSAKGKNRSRKPTNEVAFGGRWNQPLPF